MNETVIMNRLTGERKQAMRVGTVTGSILLFIAFLLCKAGIAFARLRYGSDPAEMLTHGGPTYADFAFLSFLIVIAPGGCIGAAVKLFQWAGRARNARPVTALKLMRLLNGAGKLPVEEVSERIGMSGSQLRAQVAFYGLCNQHREPGTTLDELHIVALSLRESRKLDLEREA